MCFCAVIHITTNSRINKHSKCHVPFSGLNIHLLQYSHLRKNIIGSILDNWYKMSSPGNVRILYKSIKVQSTQPEIHELPVVSACNSLQLSMVNLPWPRTVSTHKPRTYWGNIIGVTLDDQTWYRNRILPPIMVKPHKQNSCNLTENSTCTSHFAKWTSPTICNLLVELPFSNIWNLHCRNVKTCYLNYIIANLQASLANLYLTTTFVSWSGPCK